MIEWWPEVLGGGLGVAVVVQSFRWLRAKTAASRDVSLETVRAQIMEHRQDARLAPRILEALVTSHERQLKTMQAQVDDVTRRSGRLAARVDMLEGVLRTNGISVPPNGADH